MNGINRTYVSQEFLAVLFGCDQSTIARNIKLLLPMINGIFKVPQKRIKMDRAAIEMLFFDATEQATNRPQNKQRKYYSGKKKCHTIKHQVVVSTGFKNGKRKYKIEAVSGAFAGSVHDKKVYDKSRIKPPPKTTGMADSAYLGTVLKTPHKKPKNRKLSPQQKQENRAHSSKRIFVEHAIGKMKNFKIISHRYRNPRSQHSAIFKCIAGLTNLSYA